MYLEKLEIQGFKSFAHKNRLIFSGLIRNQKRDLTAIIGPNGSGKSNIADAVRWALGEQSLKTLRGKKSEDVIFSGSDKKSQLGMAEVSLFLNNADSVNYYASLRQETVIALENNQSKEDKGGLNNNSSEINAAENSKNNLDKILATCAEIVITRRVYRSGESDYLLNNSRVRLADIQMLLAKANFGQKTYSVIGQGMVENFLNSSAAERKDFFDEATGVKQFQIKRDGALNKLELSYDNLQQVDMLLSEIRPRLKSLTRHIDRLKRREEIEQELKESQLNYYGFVWQDISRQLDNFNHQYLELEKIKNEKEKRLEKLNEDLNRIRATDNSREINELQPRWRELENQKSQYQKKLDKLQGELETRLESQGQFDVSWLNNKAGELAKELEFLILEISSLEKSRPKTEEEALHGQLQEINDDLNAAEEIKRSLLNLNQERFDLNRQIAKLEAVLEAQRETRGKLDISWLENRQKELSGQIIALNQEVFVLEEATDAKTSEEIRQKIRTVQQEMDGLNRELSAINQKIKEAAKSGSKNEEISLIIEDFLKRLNQVEKVLNLEEAKRLIKEARQEFQTRIKKVLTGESDEDARRIQNIQQNIISLAEKKQKLNDQLSVELLRLAESREKLNYLREKKLQTEKEQNENASQLTKAKDSQNNSRLEEEELAANRRLASLSQEIKRLEAAYRVPIFEKKKKSILEKIQECRLRDSTINERLRLLMDKKNKTEQEINDLKDKLARSQIKFDASAIEKEKLEINQILEKLNQEAVALSARLDDLNRAKEKEKAEMFGCQKNIQALQQEIGEINSRLNEIKVNAARQETRLEDLENNIRNDKLEIGEISHRHFIDSEVDLVRWQKNIASGKNQLDQIGGIDPETEKEYEETKVRYDFLSKQTNDLNQAIKSLEQIIYELDVTIKQRFDQEFKVISEKFNEYFQILFNGGSAKMSKVMIEDLEKEELKNHDNQNGTTEVGLTVAEAEIKRATMEKMNKLKFLRKYNAVGLAGIEIRAIPPGKKIQSVAMLSGGERALTAIALICAIISANPAPFVVLDEVDAALDESNSERLARILDDLSEKTQFIVITHNRASMRRANILYGVTMQADGVSQILSVKLDEVNLDKK